LIRQDVLTVSSRPASLPITSSSVPQATTTMRPIHTLLALVGTDAVTAWVFPDGLEDGEYIVSLGSGPDDEHGTQAAQPTLLRRHSSPSSSFSSVPKHPQPQSQPRQIRRWRPKGRGRGRVMPFPFTNTTTTAGAGPTAP